MEERCIWSLFDLYVVAIWSVRMSIEWILLCEGLGTNATGNVTLIGVNTNIVVTPKLPAATKRAVFVHLTWPEQPETGAYSVDITVSDPTGNVLATQKTEFTVDGGLPWPDLPTSYDVPAEFLLPISKYGTYTIAATAAFADGSKEETSVNLYVVAPPDAAAED
jgi:hypothetical protein